MMQEFQKGTCLYHPSEYITNFCKEKSCLMPLCPTCICSHLQLHLKGGKSNPQFDNINDSLSACSQEIKVFSERFEEGRNKLNSIQRTIVEQKKDLSELIYKSKVQVRELVEAVFQEIERDLEAGIQKQNRQLGLHLPENLDALQKGIIEIGSKLREMNSDLRTDRSLSTLITFNHETRTSLEKYEADVFKEIKNNEEYSPVTSINEEALNRLRQAVSQILILKFNFPELIKQQQALQHAHQTAKTHAQQHIQGSHKHQQHQQHPHHQSHPQIQAPTKLQAQTKPQTQTHPHPHTVSSSITPTTTQPQSANQKVPLASSHTTKPTALTSPSKPTYGASSTSQPVAQGTTQGNTQTSTIKPSGTPKPQ